MRNLAMAAMLWGLALHGATPNAGNQQQTVPFKQGYQADKTQFPQGYNFPAGIDLNNGWDIEASGSFIYWQVLQDGMELGYGNPTPSATSFVVPNTGGFFVLPNFAFKPGFKVGLDVGLRFGSWGFFTQYTRLHQQTTTSKAAPNQPSGTFNSIWGPANTMTVGTSRSTNIASQWRLNLDLIDFELGSDFYVGTAWTWRPHIGFRCAWLDQYIRTVVDTNILATGAILQPALRARSISRGFGFRSGIDGDWLLGKGFVMLGNIAASLLYTRYTVVSTRDVIINPGVFNPEIGAQRESPKYLRPMLDLAYGFGWRSSAQNNRLSFDVSAIYEWQLFWNQNMMKRVAETFTSIAAVNHNLYFQGLTITAGLGF